MERLVQRGCLGLGRGMTPDQLEQLMQAIRQAA
jgi:hypothetical protein